MQAADELARQPGFNGTVAQLLKASSQRLSSAEGFPYRPQVEAGVRECVRASCGRDGLKV